MKLKRIVWIPDCHIPYEDPQAFALLLKVIADLNPDHCIIQGDFGDFYAVSDHDKDPNRCNNLEWEIQCINERLDQLDQVLKGEKVFIAGNHENRLERYLMRRAPELFNMLRLPDLFNLKKRGWKYVPYKDSFKIGKVYNTHDTERAGSNANMQAVADVGSNVTIGHIHRMRYGITGTVLGESHVGASFGWLGSFEKLDYRNKMRALRDYTHGFGWGLMEPNGTVHIQPCPIIEGKVVVEGKLYQLGK